jgi:hypothetical protein
MSLQEEVEETLEGGRLYCGDKKYRTRPPPPGIELGTRGKCFKKGIGVGAMLERTKVPDFARLTLRDLAKYARMVKVPGYGSMRRADLIAELDERRDAVREVIAAQARADLAARRAGAPSDEEEIEGGSARSAGFVKRMMAEAKLKHSGVYRRPTAPLARASKMNAPVPFVFEELPKPSGFIRKHFGPTGKPSGNYGIPESYEKPDEPTEADKKRLALLIEKARARKKKPEPAPAPAAEEPEEIIVPTEPVPAPGEVKEPSEVEPGVDLGAVPVKEFNEFLDDFRKKGLTGLFRKDYDASDIVSDLVFLHLAKKYKTDCQVIGYTRSSVPAKYTVGLDFSGLSGKTVVRPNIGEELEFTIEECIANGAKLIAIPIGFARHKNLVLYRVGLNTLERFEPHGSETSHITPTQNKRLNKMLVEIFKGLKVVPKGMKFIPENEIQPDKKGFQAMENIYQRKVGLNYEGFCQMWSMFYLELCMKYPDVPGSELVKNMRQFLIDERNPESGERFLDTIVGYVKYAEEEIGKLVSGFKFSKLDDRAKYTEYYNWYAGQVEALLRQQRIRKAKREGTYKLPTELPKKEIDKLKAFEEKIRNQNALRKAEAERKRLAATAPIKPYVENKEIKIVNLRGSGMSGGQLLSSCCGGAKAHFDEYKDILEHLSSV